MRTKKITPKNEKVVQILHASPIRPPKKEISSVVEMIIRAKFPVMICGNGVSASGAYPEVKALSDRLGIPLRQAI